MSEFKPGDLVEVANESSHPLGWMERRIGDVHVQTIRPPKKQVMMVTQVVKRANKKQHTSGVVEVLYQGETWTLPVVYLKKVDHDSK